MKANEKKFIIVLIAITILVIIVACVKKNSNKKEETIDSNGVKEEYVEVLEDGTKLNKSTKLQETKNVDGLEINDFQLTKKNNMTVLLGTITNKTNSEKGDFEVDIKILDKNGKELTTIGGYIPNIKPGKTAQLNSATTFDYSNAYDIEITKTK